MSALSDRRGCACPRAGSAGAMESPIAIKQANRCGRAIGLTARASAAARRVVVHEHNYSLTVGAVSCKRMLGGGISLAIRQIPSRRSDSAT